MRRFSIPRVALALVASVALVACSGQGKQEAGSGILYDPKAPTITHGLLEGKPYDGEEVTFLICCSTAAQFVRWHQSVPEFTELTGIKVDFTNDPLDGLREKIITQSVSDPGSWDVTMFFDTWLPELTGFLEPLENTMPVDLEDYAPVIRDLVKYDGVTYGVPVRSNVMTLSYRADVFEKLGLKVPTSYDELLDTAKTISESDLGIAGFTMNWAKQPSISPSPWLNFVQASGGAIFDADGMPTFTTPEVLAASKIYRELVNYAPAGAIAFNEGDSRSAYAQGKAAMTIGWSWFYEIYTGPSASPEVRDNTSFSFITPAKDGPGNPMAFTWPLGISASSEHKGAAAEWIKWVSNPELELDIITNKSDPATATVVANRLSVLRDPAANTANNGYSEAMADAYEKATHQPIYVGYSSVTEIIEVALSNIMSGADIESTLRDAEKQATDVLKRIDS